MTVLSLYLSGAATRTRPKPWSARLPRHEHGVSPTEIADPTAISLHEATHRTDERTRLRGCGYTVDGPGASDKPKIEVKGDLRSKPIPPGELERTAPCATTDENFVTAYWRRLRDKPVSVDYLRFLQRNRSSPRGVWSSGRRRRLHCGRSQRRCNQPAARRSRRPVDASAGPVKLHDVKHRLLIERLRGDSNRRFSNAGYWFLTADSSLPRYDYAARQGTDRLPLRHQWCVASSDPWPPEPRITRKRSWIF